MLDRFKNFFNCIKYYKDHLNKTDRKKFNNYIFIVVLSTLIQTIGISGVIPFISVFFNNEILMEQKIFTSFLNFFNIDTIQIQLVITLAFFSIIVISYIINHYTIKKGIELSFLFENQIKLKVYNSKLNQSYENQLEDSSTKIMSILTQKSQLISGMINSYFLFINSAMLISFLLFFILIYQFKFFLLIFFFIIIVLFLFLKKNKTHLRQSSSKLNYNQDQIIKIFNDTIGHFNEIKLYSLEKKFIEKFSKINNFVNESLVSNKKLIEIPRLKIEYYLILILIPLIYILDLITNLKLFIPEIAFLAFSVQKITPAINKLYSSVSSFEGASKPILEIIKSLKILKKQQNVIKINNENILFKQKIELRSIDFSYKNKKKIIENFNLKIKKNSKIAISGKTGIGKSTLGKIISGTLIPFNGNIYVDDIKIDEKNLKSWQRKISIMPQNIFLQNESVYKNLLIGVKQKKISKQTLKKIIKISRLDEFIKNYKDLKIKKVGENGSRLSGGQKQRVAIARALLRNPEILIIDEGTNNLDKKTQNQILNNLINLKNLTLIIISHDKEVLKKFNLKIKLK